MIVGTRDSELAMRQTEIFLEALKGIAPELRPEVKPMKSSGDIDLKSPLDKLQGFGAFVRELDAALLSGKIDVAVNSMKDMPVDIPEGLCIPAVLKRADIRDVCIPCSLDDLKEGSVVGTSSIRRAAIIRDIRPDLQTEVLRGNVRTRLSKLDSGKYDAIILAKAGLDCLGADRKCVPLDADTFIPAPAQGAIAIVCRSDDRDTVELLSELNDYETRCEVDAERRIMKMLGAGCSSPVGINARYDDGMLNINAVSFETGKKLSFKGRIPTRFTDGDCMDVVNALTGKPAGHVYLVGAGPGDMGLMTVRGMELLRSADVVVYDALADHSLMRECPNAELINVGKRSKNHIKTQDQTNALLVEYAKKGLKVVRLKGGDPFLFGRGAEEAAVLRKAGVEVSVVPGVSSSIAVPELAGIPVTHRDHASSVTILTGHGKEGTDGVDWVQAAKVPGTIVILMGMDNTEEISKGLMKGGRSPDMPAGVVTDGGMTTQRAEVTTLGNLHAMVTEKGLKAPGIIIIGDVVTERSLLGDLS